MSTDKLITNIVNSFKKQLSSDSESLDSERVSNILREVLTLYQEELVGGKKSTSRKSKAGQEDRPKKTNWQAVWTSNDAGCHAYPEFKDQLEVFIKESPDLDRFSVNKNLRQWADSQNKYEEWKKWARDRLEAAGKPVPQDKPVKVNTEASPQSVTVASPKPKLAKPSESKPVPKEVQMKATGKSAVAKKATS